MSRKQKTSLLGVFLLCFMLITGTCLAGTSANTTKSIESLPNIDSIIYLSTGSDQQIPDKELENKSIVTVTSFEALLKAFNDSQHAAIIVDKNAVSLIDVKSFQELMVQYKPVVLLGYSEVKNGSGIERSLTFEFTGGDAVRFNGFSAVVVNKGAISQFGAFSRSGRSLDELLGFINRINQEMAKGGYFEDNSYQNEVYVENNSEEQAVQSEPLNIPDENSSVKTAGNHLIKVFDSTSTSRNKVYGSRSTSNIVSNLYYGEVIMDRESSSTTTSNGTTTYWNMVEYYDGSSYQTGYMIYAIDNGDEWWHGGFMLCYTLDSFIDQNRSSYSSYVTRRSVNGQYYYGIKARASSALYNSSGSQIRTTSSNDWLWVTGPNYCGSSNHHYMTVQGYSTSKTGTITTYSSTTFFNAKFNNSHPNNYAIWTRLP